MAADSGGRARVKAPAEIPRPAGRSPLARPDVEAIWIAAAAQVGLVVGRTRDAYASTDGAGGLWIGEDDTLDEDDSLPQLVFHELCHALVAGPDTFDRPDFGLDNTSDLDLVQEHASLRLGLALARPFGLGALMAPTTVYRPYHDAIVRTGAARALAGADPAARRARAAAARAAGEPFSSALGASLEATRRLIWHPAGAPRQVTRVTCRDCAWWMPGGRCRALGGPRGARTDAAEPACVRFEGPLDCAACAACCRQAYDTVEVGPGEAVVRLHPSLVVLRGGDGAPRRAELPRPGGLCVALEGTAGSWSCRIYADRPRTCRDFARGGRHCLDARRKLGLSPAAPGDRNIPRLMAP